MGVFEWTDAMKSAAMQDAATVVKQSERIAELEAALSDMIHIFDPLALTHPPESHNVRMRLERAREVMAKRRG